MHVGRDLRVLQLGQKETAERASAGGVMRAGVGGRGAADKAQQRRLVAHDAHGRRGDHRGQLVGDDRGLSERGEAKMKK